MAQNHLFSCTNCEKDFPVNDRSAGMPVSCPFCEHINNLPGMRQIRALPIAEGTPLKKSRKESSAKRFLFSGGLLVAVIGGLLGIALSYYADSLATELRLEEKIDFGNQYVDDMTPGHLWEAWDAMATKGLPDWQETHDVRYNKQAGYLKSIAYGLFGICGIGLLSLLLSFVVGNKR